MSNDSRILKNNIKEDLIRLSGSFSYRALVKKLLINNSFKITFWFRISSYLQAKGNIPYKIINLFPWMMLRHYQYKLGIQLYAGTKVGKGLLFPHFSCIIIHRGIEIGDNCTLFQGITIGSVRGKNGLPVIGNNVVIGPGAKVLGNVKVGDNVFIGANAVVVKDVPDNAVVGGIPAKVISYDGPIQTGYYRWGY